MKPIHLDRDQTKEIERRRHETHDRRIYERLSALLWVAAGQDRFGTTITVTHCCDESARGCSLPVADSRGTCLAVG